MENVDQSNKKFFMLVLIAFLGYGINYIFNLILSHNLSNGLYGNFTLALKTLNIFSFCILLGTASSAKRFLSEYLSEHDQTDSSDYIRWNLKFIARSVIIFLSLLTTLLIVIIALHLFQIKHIASYHLSVYLLFITPLCALSTLIASYLECNDNIILYNLINYGKFFLFSILILAVVYFFHPTFNNLLLWIITLAVYGLLCCIECILAAIYLPNDIVRTLLRFTKPLASNASKIWEKTSLRLALSQLIYLITSIIDLYAVKFFTNKTAIDQYSAVLSISGIITLVSGSIFSLLVASLSFDMKNQKYASLQEALNRTNRKNFLVLFFMTFFIIYFGHFILSLFGPGYDTKMSYNTLIILTLGYFFSTFCYGAIQLLSYSGHAIWVVYVSLAEIIFIIFFAILLTPAYGIIGAAFASILTLTASTIAYIFIARWKTSIKSFVFV